MHDPEVAARQKKSSFVESSRVSRRAKRRNGRAGRRDRRVPPPEEHFADRDFEDGNDGEDSFVQPSSQDTAIPNEDEDRPRAEVHWTRNRHRGGGPSVLDEDPPHAALLEEDPLPDDELHEDGLLVLTEDSARQTTHTTQPDTPETQPGPGHQQDKAQERAAKGAASRPSSAPHSTQQRRNGGSSTAPSRPENEKEEHTLYSRTQIERCALRPGDKFTTFRLVEGLYTVKYDTDLVETGRRVLLKQGTNIRLQFNGKDFGGSPRMNQGGVRLGVIKVKKFPMAGLTKYGNPVPEHGGSRSSGRGGPRRPGNALLSSSLAEIDEWGQSRNASEAQYPRRRRAGIPPDPSDFMDRGQGRRQRRKKRRAHHSTLSSGGQSSSESLSLDGAEQSLDETAML